MTRVGCALLSAVAAAALLCGIGARGHWESADGRPPLVARDMVETGRFHPPYLAGEPYLNKPPLFHGLVAVSFRVFGEGRVSARLPAVLAGVLAVLMTAVLTSRAAGPAAGFASGLLLLGCHRFFTMGRSSELETLLVLCACMNYVGMDAALRRHGSRRSWGVAFACLGGALAAWTKGPLLALLFPTAFAVGSASSARSWRPLFSSGWLWVVGAVVVATLGYYLPFLADEGMREALEERLALRNNSHRRGAFYYVGKLPAGMLPAVLILPWMVGAIRRQWTVVGRWVATALVLFVVFSAFPAKQSHYLLPLYPLLCACGGVAFTRLVASARRWPFVVVGGLTTVVGLVGAPVAFARCDDLPLQATTLGLQVATAALGATVLVLTRTQGARPRSRTRIGFIALLSLLAAVTTFDTYQAHVRDGERSAESAMTRFAEIIGSSPVASLDRKATVLYYLGRDDVTLPADAEEARGFLSRTPNGYLVIQHEKGDVVPEPLSGAPVAAGWSSPSGRRGFLLLGPGLR